MKELSLGFVFLLCVSSVETATLHAQALQSGSPATPAASTDEPELPSGYVIGADDVLNVVFWREPDMSAEVIVRPDGRISLPLLNEVHAQGQTPTELRATLT